MEFILLVSNTGKLIAEVNDSVERETHGGERGRNLQKDVLTGKKG